MNLEEMIKIGKNNTENDENYYYWLEKVEEYLSNIPNKTYIEKAKDAIKNARFFDNNFGNGKKAKKQITAILMTIYDNEQEKFLEENITKELLSIFTDIRLKDVKEQFEEAIKFKNMEQFKQSVIEICKSIESMMKLICKEKRYIYNETDSFDSLLKILKENNIIPLNGMISGFQIMRNKTSAHGATDTTYEPDKYDVNFEINRGASLLLYLYEKSNL